MSVCPNCGLPNELCVCETIAKESQTVIVKTVKRKFGKMYTEVKGLNSTEINIKDLAKKLKSKLACGGTVKNDIIELQGNHKEKVKNILIGLGFNSDSIQLY